MLMSCLLSSPGPQGDIPPSLENPLQLFEQEPRSRSDLSAWISVGAEQDMPRGVVAFHLLVSHLHSQLQKHLLQLWGVTTQEGMK